MERGPRDSCLVSDPHVGVFFLWELSKVTRMGRLWDAILVTDDGFGALMCNKCAQSRRFGLGSGGDGGDTIARGGGGGGGLANREPDHIFPL